MPKKKILNRGQIKSKPIKYNFASRKFLLLLILILVTTTIMTYKINSPDFESMFKDWCLFLVSIYAVYNGGNVSAKYVEGRIKKYMQQPIYDQQNQQVTSPEYGIDGDGI